jgi:hypothetical protein
VKPDSTVLSASLSREPIWVECQGRQYVIAYRSASEWISALASDASVWSVFPGMLEPPQEQFVSEGLIYGTVDIAEVRRAGLYAIRQASGRRWWEAIRLVGMVDNSEDMGASMGAMTMAGVDPDVMPFGRWLAAAYWLGVKGRDDKERMMFHARLSMAPDIPEAFEEEASGDEFAAMVRAAQSLPGMSGPGR